MKPIYPYFGNKILVARDIWERLGNVQVYVEPFAGSLAVLLGRPHAPGQETINELDGHITNFWRSVKADPQGVAHHCDSIVSEIDMESRHRVLVATSEELVKRLQDDPSFHDSELAGWWVWGISAWIGGEWCTPARARQKHMPDMPQKGVHRRSLWAEGASKEQIMRLMNDLALRTRGVRVLNGDWSRAVKKSVIKTAVLGKTGVTGIVFDPPYGDETRDMNTYQQDSATVAADVRTWCLENGADPQLRIALCGYDGEHDVLLEHGWTVIEWKAMGGYGRLGEGNDNTGMNNRHRERVWFSPACLSPGRPTAVSLFEAIGAVLPADDLAPGGKVVV